MTLNELKFVLAVAKELNFRRAAEKCFVTQPGLSLGIKKLEEELGVALFERNRNEVKPTDIGEKIIAQASVVLDEANKIKEMAKLGNDPLLGIFKLGVIHSVGPYLLPEMIPKLIAVAPQMPLEVEENLTTNLEQHLRNGTIDAAVIALPFKVPGIDLVHLYEEPFNVVVPAVHPWANRTHIHPEELSNEKVLLLNTGHCFSNQITEACPELSRKGEVLQGNSLETIRNMVSSNLGITVLPAMATASRYQNQLLKVIPFTAPSPSRQIALAWRKSMVRKQAIDVLAKVIQSLQQKIPIKDSESLP